MVQEAETHADEDRRRRGAISLRNDAEAMVLQAENTLRDYGDRVPSELKMDLDTKVQAVKEILEQDRECRSFTPGLRGGAGTHPGRYLDVRAGRSSSAGRRHGRQRRRAGCRRGRRRDSRCRVPRESEACRTRDREQAQSRTAGVTGSARRFLDRFHAESTS